jgi:nitrile hydratase accessory protein
MSDARTAFQKLIATDRPTFEQPWEAEAFALAVAAHDRGLFTWSEWAATLGRVLADAGEAGGGTAYYQHWLTALEAITVAKGVASAATLHAVADAWIDAAAHTPHGQPITPPLLEGAAPVA